MRSKKVEYKNDLDMYVWMRKASRRILDRPIMSMLIETREVEIKRRIYGIFREEINGLYDRGLQLKKKLKNNS
jgi:alpha-D-ribose 1-methylphosphonate 5-triphosphate synthase subunit PhnI